MKINAIVQPAGFVLPVTQKLLKMLIKEKENNSANTPYAVAVTLNLISEIQIMTQTKADIIPSKSGWLIKAIHGVSIMPPTLVMSGKYIQSWKRSSISVGLKVMSGSI